MDTPPSPSRLENFLHWIARIWSLLVLFIALAVIFIPDPYAIEPVPLKDWELLYLWDLSILGLLVAWRWERLGVFITIAALFLCELLLVIFNGQWHLSFLIFWAGVLPPALMFLAVWKMGRKRTNYEPE